MIPKSEIPPYPFLLNHFIWTFNDCKLKHQSKLSRSFIIFKINSVWVDKQKTKQNEKYTNNVILGWIMFVCFHGNFMYSNYHLIDKIRKNIKIMKFQKQFTFTKNIILNFKNSLHKQNTVCCGQYLKSFHLEIYIFISKYIMKVYKYCNQWFP